MNTILPIGATHGRFQPFHNGHLRYLLEASKRCDFLYVGVTQCDDTLADCPQARHRQMKSNNPLTYQEREELITEILIDAGLNTFKIVRFPIEVPSSLPAYIPTSIPMFTVICEDWNDYKVQLLRELGYEVLILWEDRNRDFDGMRIRDLICAGDLAWKALVPRKTAEYIERHQLRSRILEARGFQLP